ncbi:unnamed protein product [marine sediment metagenome]|uniref:Uncharacterized protein n=1 Tax=marine sediment metagenome TaxID=412755 RepID=X1PHL7_9ZZZZ
MAVVATSSSGGIVQTWILREYVDKEYGLIPGLEGLGGFGTYSAIGGILSGGITTGLGLISILTKKITKNETIQLGLIGYGIPALSGGILSGLFPHPEVPGLRLKPAGGPAGNIKLQYAGIPGQPARGQAGQTPGIPLRT